MVSVSHPACFASSPIHMAASLYFSLYLVVTQRFRLKICHLRFRGNRKSSEEWRSRAGEVPHGRLLRRYKLRNHCHAYTARAYPVGRALHQCCHVCGGRLAAKTSRIRLGTAVVTVPLYEPVRVVENLAFVDILSGGRGMLGLGSGYRPREFAGLARDFDARRDVQEEAIELILELLHARRVK